MFTCECKRIKNECAKKGKQTTHYYFPDVFEKFHLKICTLFWLVNWVWRKCMRCQNSSMYIADHAVIMWDECCACADRALSYKIHVFVCLCPSNCLKERRKKTFTGMTHLTTRQSESVFVCVSKKHHYSWWWEYLHLQLSYYHYY